MTGGGYTLIFDCDGVLADTERHGHLPAFNGAFAELGIPMRWSEDDYADLVRIGGGKERITAALAEPRHDGLFGQDGVPDDVVPRIHKLKTAIYRSLVADGVMPPRTGVARLIRSALSDGWQVAVASTSAPESVRSVLDSVVGQQLAESIPIFAGDAVPAKKPAPDIYLLALNRLGADPDKTIVVEDSAVGMRAALSAGLACIVTPSSYTLDEDFTPAAAVVTSLGDTGHPTAVVSDPHHVGFGDVVDIEALRRLLALRSQSLSSTGVGMSPIESVRAAVRIIADTAVHNEQYFCELDAVAGDGDFGFSLARGFESVLENWDAIDATTPSSFLRGVATTLSNRLGGTSGPIWGTAFMRAGAAVKERTELGLQDAHAMIDAAIGGIERRGGATVGDKTLLDALYPVRDELASATTRSDAPAEVAAAVAAAARRGAEQTKELKASRGRASYVGDRSIGYEDPGAVAVAVMAENIAQAWSSSTNTDPSRPLQEESHR